MHLDEIERRFTYHRPSGNQPERYETIRRWARSLALLFNRNVPDCREREIAIGKLEEAVMWANAGIARRENPVPETSAGDINLGPGPAVGMSVCDGETLIFPEGADCRKSAPFKVSSHLEAYEKGFKRGSETILPIEFWRRRAEVSKAASENYELGVEHGKNEAAISEQEIYEKGRLAGQKEICGELNPILDLKEQIEKIFGRR